MYHQEFKPPEALRDIIKCFWYDRRDPDEMQSGFEVQPDGYAEIIFNFGSDLCISHNGDLRQLPSLFIMGLLNQPVVCYSKSGLEIIGIRCFPWTVFDLLELQPGKDHVRLFDHPISQLQDGLDKLVRAGEISESLAIIKQYFLNTLSRISANGMLLKAGAAMQAKKGTMPVSQVAAAAHATVRTLERNFKLASGYSVKDVSVLMRFEQVRNRLWLHPDSSIASLVHELGYTDQSHLSREFKRYSGTTPGAFARKSKKRKQAATNDFIAFI